jgi:para-aminobenzoate synthetase/4-amino-4-deoxychorismate lyase
VRVSCNVGGRLRSFDEPERLIVARNGAEVEAAFREVEAALEGGAYVAGYASYELGAHFVPKQAEPHAGELPLLAFGVYGQPRETSLAGAGAGAYSLGAFEPAVDSLRYEEDLSAILAAIRDGDVYQVNYSVPFAFAFEGEPFALFADLLAGGSYPHAAFIDMPACAIVSASPELFVALEAGRLVTKPMKGTAKAGDARQLENPKNRAEHVMIVDLLRNDVHRISDDVAVERLCEIERYQHFSTMTSTIAGTIDPALSLRDIFAAMFPCGSVTGAPKVAAMQCIARTERRNRGIFCGAIGYIGPDRRASWNVAIRTATIDKASGRGRLAIGGGIVADSTVSGEWEEILTKLAPFAALVRPVSLQTPQRT